MHHGDALQRTNATEAPRFHRCSKSSAGRASTPSRTFGRRNFRKARPLRGPEPWVKQLRVLPVQAAGLPDSKTEQPPPIGRAEVVAFALVALLVISIVAVLYVAKAFFLPVVTAFVVGTMLSPAAGFLERHRIPRAVSAVLIVTAAGAGVAFIVGLISSPLMEWSTRLPELGSLLRDKLHVFDRPLALWQELQSMVGGSDTLVAFQMPKFDRVHPPVEFLSPPS